MQEGSQGYGVVIRVTEHGRVQTALGPALRIQIEREDKAKMGFRELWETFESHYPDQWAIQLFPPKTYLFDQANKYHLHVLQRRPEGFDLFDPTEKRMSETWDDRGVFAIEMSVREYYELQREQRRDCETLEDTLLRLSGLRSRPLRNINETLERRRSDDSTRMSRAAHTLSLADAKKAREEKQGP